MTATMSPRMLSILENEGWTLHLSPQLNPLLTKPSGSATAEGEPILMAIGIYRGDNSKWAAAYVRQTADSPTFTFYKTLDKPVYSDRIRRVVAAVERDNAKLIAKAGARLTLRP